MTSAPDHDGLGAPVRFAVVDIVTLAHDIGHGFGAGPFGAALFADAPRAVRVQRRRAEGPAGAECRLLRPRFDQLQMIGQVAGAIPATRPFHRFDRRGQFAVEARLFHVFALLGVSVLLLRFNYNENSLEMFSLYSFMLLLGQFFFDFILKKSPFFVKNVRF